MAEGKEPGAQVPDFGEQYDVVVVGAGIGGLVSGALLAGEGLKVLVVERGKRPGGYVTAYERKGYRFQVPHLVAGCGPDGDITRVANHLGLKVEFARVDPYQRCIYPDHDIQVRCDVEAFKNTLKDNFQTQTENINQFFKAVSSVQKGLDIRMMRRPMGAGSMLKYPVYPLLHPRFFRYMVGRSTFQDMLDRFFTDEKLKAVLSTSWYWMGTPPWEISPLGMIGMMGAFRGGAYFPVGGYDELSNGFTAALIENGGELLLDHEVTSVNAEHGRVSEVEMHPRAIVKTTVVISDCDTRRTFFRLVNRENLTEAFLKKLEKRQLSTSGLVVHLGMAKKIEDESFACGSVLVQPSYDLREAFEEISVTDRYPDPGKIGFMVTVPSMVDPTLAPEGKTCLDLLVPGVPYDFMGRWGVESGGVRGERYRSIKEKYAEVVVEAATMAFPGLVSDVEAYDVSTPITYERHTMSIDGCWYDDALIPGQVLGRRYGPRTSLRGLYITGSKSALGGGICSSIMSGVLAADSVLKGKLGALISAPH
ncbi:MAG: NAD(P)/FAD-dependent oxidoreductase [Actinobacteria bacterium]|nr:NAD(P)/FAD-dependent oxidoreductase [Actinomycetota bacterium]MCG2819115.1 NAD(P)/FAD-dependent oxidoreductase [Actinomycetes bacterium]MBU4218722.1 NAD(P)/FAD-dependent oxidoreductase [Actinomycetota bacterium]MBU4359451.1 NAD(P)/FAD-dependent oxidoreductase [Actinomycetota bacterium]MBU4391322.1 NAD(P)/FAD-dependent oxidoreductase [Actinomycetota bacterium]